MKGEFERYFFENFIHLDGKKSMPGVIFANHFDSFFTKRSKARIVFFFEDIISNLFLETVNRFGEKRAEEVWYKIGKDFGIRYFLFSNRRFSKCGKERNLESVFDYFRASGFGFLEEIIPGSSVDSFRVRGRESVFFDRINNGSFFAGILAGLLSGYYNENLEASFNIDDFGIVLIIASRRFKKRYSPISDFLVPHFNYNKINSFVKKNESSNRKIGTFLDFLRFKKIRKDENFNKWSFFDNGVFPVEVGFLGIVTKRYLDEGMSDVFRSVYIESSREIFNKMLESKPLVKNRASFVVNVLSGLGWGVPYFIHRKNEVVVRFLNPPFSKYGVLGRAFVLNGIVNSVFGTSYFLKSAVDSEFVYSLE